MWAELSNPTLRLFMENLHLAVRVDLACEKLISYFLMVEDELLALSGVAKPHLCPNLFNIVNFLHGIGFLVGCRLGGCDASFGPLPLFLAFFSEHVQNVSCSFNARILVSQVGMGAEETECTPKLLPPFQEVVSETWRSC